MTRKLSPLRLTAVIVGLDPTATLKALRPSLVTFSRPVSGANNQHEHTRTDAHTNTQRTTQKHGAKPGANIHIPTRIATHAPNRFDALNTHSHPISLVPCTHTDTPSLILTPYRHCGDGRAGGYSSAKVFQTGVRDLVQPCACVAGMNTSNSAHHTKRTL